MIRLLTRALVAAIVVAAVVGVFLLWTLWVQFLWNGLAADVFGAPSLSFFKTILFVLAVSSIRLFTRTTLNIKR